MQLADLPTAALLQPLLDNEHEIPRDTSPDHCDASGRCDFRGNRNRD